VTLQSFSWTTFGHASKRPWEISDIVDMLETWEAATEAASRQ
jgi:hypothetical protein